MNAGYSSSSSRIARVASVVAACLVTVSLFGAVAIGLTGEFTGDAMALNDMAHAAVAYG